MSKKFNANLRMKDQNSIQDVLDIMIKGYRLEAGMDQLNIKEAWTKVLGPGVASYTLEVVLKKEVLYVALSSAVLREELSYGKEKIMTMLNEEVRKELVKDIVFR